MPKETFTLGPRSEDKFTISWGMARNDRPQVAEVRINDRLLATSESLAELSRLRRVVLRAESLLHAVGGVEDLDGVFSREPAVTRFDESVVLTSSEVQKAITTWLSRGPAISVAVVDTTSVRATNVWKDSTFGRDDTRGPLSNGGHNLMVFDNESRVQAFGMDQADSVLHYQFSFFVISKEVLDSVNRQRYLDSVLGLPHRPDILDNLTEATRFGDQPTGVVVDSY